MAATHPDLAGTAARLLQVITQAGIDWRLARTWQGTRQRERQLAADRQRTEQDHGTGDEQRNRVIIDQIASLTDTSALAWHKRLCNSCSSELRFPSLNQQ